MKISKTWCGLFATVTTGLSAAAYYAGRTASSRVTDATTKFVNGLLNANITLQNVSVTIHHILLPQPVTAAIDLKFSLRKALTDDLVKVLDELPTEAGATVQYGVWEQIGILALVLGIGALGIYNYRKSKAQGSTSSSKSSESQEPLLANDSLAAPKIENKKSDSLGLSAQVDPVIAEQHDQMRPGVFGAR